MARDRSSQSKRRMARGPNSEPGRSERHRVQSAEDHIVTARGQGMIENDGANSVRVRVRQQKEQEFFVS